MKCSNQKESYKSNIVKYMKKHYDRCSLNNKGMSLVEVIVSITILSLVIVPVLHAITSSMYFNAKARTRQNVTVAAESLMETFKGYDLASIKGMFDSGAIPGITLEAGGSMSAPADIKANTLEFNVNGMQTENDKLYNVKITAVSAGTVSEVLELENVDPTKDAIFRGDRDFDKNAADKAIDSFKANHMDDFLTAIKAVDARTGTSLELEESDIDFSMLALKERETVYTISSDGTNNKVTAKMTYRYRMERYPYFKPVGSASEDDEEESTEEDVELEDESATFNEIDSSLGYVEEKYMDFPADGEDFLEVVIGMDISDDTIEELVVYDNSVSAGLDRFFIYYYPCYDDEIKDIIKIQNPSGMEMECYLIKQKAADMTSAQLQVRETRYKPTITGDTNVILLHNFTDNIGDDSSLPIPVGISSATFSKVEHFTENTRVKKEKVLVYDIKIEVFDENGVVVSELDGSKTEKYMDVSAATP